MINSRYNDEGRIINLKFEFSSINKVINVKSFFVVRSTEIGEKNPNPTPGVALESYRTEMKESSIKAKEYFSRNKKEIMNFIDGIKKKEITYDYVNVFYPSDSNRTEVLQKFSSKLHSGKNDYSDYFYKTQDKSVVRMECSDAEKLFNYEKPKTLDKPLKSILLIDDTIDTGCTIKIFLSKLFNEGLIDNDTEISAKIIYNNFKDSFPKISPDFLKKLKKG